MIKWTSDMCICDNIQIDLQIKTVYYLFAIILAENFIFEVF